MQYQPNYESVSQHAVPEWYHNAKLGIFIHWGLYSVPAWAQVGAVHLSVGSPACRRKFCAPIGTGGYVAL